MLADFISDLYPNENVETICESMYWNVCHYGSPCEVDTLVKKEDVNIRYLIENAPKNLMSL